MNLQDSLPTTPMAAPTPDQSRMPHRFRCDFSVGDAIGNMILWIVLIVVTLGLAAFVFPYYIPKAIIAKTTVLGHDGSEVGRLKCDLTLSSMIGNAFIWLVLTVITMGLAYFVYIYRVLRVVLMETRIEYNGAQPA